MNAQPENLNLNGLYSQGTGAVLDSNTNIPSALICAGVYSDECHIVGGGNDIAASKLNTQRRFASSMLIDPAILWITGKKKMKWYFLFHHLLQRDSINQTVFKEALRRLHP